MAEAAAMAEGIRLVCFDWGGVILKHCRAWSEACVVAGLPVREGVDSHDKVIRRREATAAFQRGKIDPERYYHALAEASDWLYSTHEIQRLHDAWVTEEYPGVDAVIHDIHARKRETALLSNTNEAHWKRHLPGPRGERPDFPTAGLLRHRLGSHQLGLVKPGIEIYRALEKATGHEGDRVLFFDDIIDNVNAARSIGWHAELIDHTGDTAAQLRTHLGNHGVL
jgi:putative hydrolase of the HAD superfamily